METTDFLEQLAEVLNVYSVNQSDELDTFEHWNSEAISSIINLVFETYGKSLSVEEVRKAKTVEGLLNLIQSK